jgi:tyrosyl-tRNA synthetase
MHPSIYPCIHPSIIYLCIHPSIYLSIYAEDVKRKIKKAYCPPEVVEKNPILDYSQHIILGYYGTMTVTTSTVSGG